MGQSVQSGRTHSITHGMFIQMFKEIIGKVNIYIKYLFL